ncbi:hypothetical protein EYF80_017237 [Liparis tanakae]|uniref:Uncharacterized protein n=1 Tax=Liparis tanakae TaxID=230148 RepID=A0A4Z2I3X0_9TELE|nr:hypothetical protein EYF80_017237 [Liparis tanakae]
MASNRRKNCEMMPVHHFQSKRLLRYSRFMSLRGRSSSQPITAQCSRLLRLSMSRRKCSTATSWAEPELMV